MYMTPSWTMGVVWKEPTTLVWKMYFTFMFLTLSGVIALLGQKRIWPRSPP